MFSAVNDKIATIIRTTTAKDVANGVMLGCIVLYAVGYFVRSVKA